jgi:hypothetical protein
MLSTGNNDDNDDDFSRNSDDKSLNPREPQEKQKVKVYRNEFLF